MTGIVELIAGWLVYTLGDGARYWDYNDQPWNFGNIGGFVCLRSVLVFGFSALLLMYLIVPGLFYLAMKLPKEKYLGCCAWFFLILNWIKLPVFVFERRVTWQSVQLDLCMLPFIIAGGVLGIVLLRKLPQKIFENIIQALVIIASLRLLWG